MMLRQILEDTISDGLAEDLPAHVVAANALRLVEAAMQGQAHRPNYHGTLAFEQLTWERLFA